MIGFYSFNNSIYANYRVQKDNKAISLKYFPGIRDEGWNKTTRRFKDDELNRQIVNIEKAAMEVIKANDPLKLTSKTFSGLINEILTGKIRKETPFFEYCERYFEYACKITSRRRAQTVRTTIHKIQEFRPDLTFERVDKKFFREFMAYCNDKNFATNYTGSVVRDLKRILNYATDNEDNSNMAFKSFKKPMEDVFNVYLTEDEIKKIYDLEINEQSVLKLWKDKPPTKERPRSTVRALDRARKLFVIGCWTGLRVENYLSIDPGIQVDLKKGFIHAIANKNGPKLRIPLHQLVRHIVEDGGFPTPISPQKLNRHIKDLGELAGIDETIIYSKTIGGKRIEYVKKKYEMITTHTARRSFCSNLIAKGIPKQFIMAVSGHKTESSFNKYTQSVQKDILTSKLAEYDIWN